MCNVKKIKGLLKRYVYGMCNGLFPPTETETDPHTDSCTMQVFSLVWRRIPIPLLKYSKIGMEICLWDGDLSLKWVQ